MWANYPELTLNWGARGPGACPVNVNMRPLGAERVQLGPCHQLFELRYEVSQHSEMGRRKTRSRTIPALSDLSEFSCAA